MAINEIFPNATVAQVIFQIRFPNLFYLEGRMGEFQVQVMRDFPKSSLTLARRLLIAQGERIPDALKGQEESMGPDVDKIWNFQSETGVELHVKTDSLDLSSTVHKTYNNPNGAHRFRDSIKKAVDAFLEITKLPILTRIGLRYIDKCPVPAVSNDAFRNYYRTCLALDRFSLPDAEELTHVARARRGQHFVRVAETFRNVGGKPELTLDFDAYATGVTTGDYLAVTDRLHEVVVAEFEQYLNPPAYEFMRGPAK